MQIWMVVGLVSLPCVKHAAPALTLFGSAVDRAEFAVFVKLLAGYKPGEDKIHEMHARGNDDDY